MEWSQAACHIKKWGGRYKELGMISFMLSGPKNGFRRDIITEDNTKTYLALKTRQGQANAHLVIGLALIFREGWQKIIVICSSLKCTSLFHGNFLTCAHVHVLPLAFPFLKNDYIVHSSSKFIFFPSPSNPNTHELMYLNSKVLCLECFNSNTTHGLRASLYLYISACGYEHVFISESLDCQFFSLS